MYDFVSKQDKEAHEALAGEERRQAEGLELIPSENYVSRAVREALGSAFTNKYSEGYPGLRYYGGQEYTDDVERLAIERAKKLFGADHANVQPLGGANANMAVYCAWLEPGDTVLGFDLSHGGHLTHGHPVTTMAKFFNFVRYKMSNPDTGEIDYEEMRALAREHRPKIILAGASAYPREFDYAKIREIAQEVGAVAMADIAHTAGLVAAGVLPNPFAYGFDVVTTTTHKTLRGPRGGMILTKGTVSNPLKAPDKTVENLPTLIDRAVFPGLQGGPHMHAVAAKAVAFGEALCPSFKAYAAQVLKNAKAMEEVLRERGVRMLTGGTSNHLILADVWKSFGIGGKEAENALSHVGITLNKNAIADDARKPADPSGIRFGTPAMTTRGFTEQECAQVAGHMLDALEQRAAPAALARIHADIKEMCAARPIPDSFI